MYSSVMSISSPSGAGRTPRKAYRSEEHTSELQSPCNLVCRLLLEKKSTREGARARKRGGVRADRTRACAQATRHGESTAGPEPDGGVQRQGLSSQYFFFFNDTATTEIYTLSLHDALPIYYAKTGVANRSEWGTARVPAHELDRKSTRLNSSHLVISYAVFCLKKKTRT